MPTLQLPRGLEPLSFLSDVSGTWLNPASVSGGDASLDGLIFAQFARHLLQHFPYGIDRRKASDLAEALAVGASTVTDLCLLRGARNATVQVSSIY